MDLKDMIRQAHRPETTVPVCLRGDLVAEWEALDRQIDSTRKRDRQKLAESETVEVADRMAELEAEMTEATLTVRLRALPRREWMALCDEHKPREGDDADKAMNVNRDTFYDGLIHASVTDPELSRIELDELLAVLTSRQFDALVEAAWRLNRHDVNVPFSPTASRIKSSSDGTSKPQSGSESATNGSVAGNPKKSPSTPTTTLGG